MTTRNATVGEWRALLTHRAARHHDGRFLVHGRAAITAAVANDWPIEALLYRLGAPEPPAWARELLDRRPGNSASGRPRAARPPASSVSSPRTRSPRRGRCSSTTSRMRRSS
ncbi:hypothetical protein ACWDSJ_19530 [Nocardia sp. NPDC003482]